jgi:Gas vesicle protein G
MGLISGLLTLPLAPVRGVVWVAEQVKEEAERQWSSPAAIQEALNDVEAQRDAGQLTDAEADARQEELLERLLAGSASGMTLEPEEEWDG